jgi:hypothetical protein
MQIRKCYLLTCDLQSERALFCKKILETIGFQVILFQSVPNILDVNNDWYKETPLSNDVCNKVLSNKLSMLKIYEIISNGEHEYVYVFEDDINVLENITIDEIIEYEKISEHFFYLGLCDNSYNSREIHSTKINNHDVTIVSGGIRGLHAIGLSKTGAKELLQFSEEYQNYIYMDMILEKFSEKYPANVVRFDLESYIHGHRGIIFQDRNKFASTI